LPTRYLKLTVLLFAVSHGAYAATFEVTDTLTKSRSIFFVELGTAINYLKDYSFSPLNNRSGGLVIKSGFKRSTKHDSRHLYINVDFVKGKFKPSESSFSSSLFVNGNIELGYLMKVANEVRGKPIPLFFGPQYNSLIHYMQWKDMDSWSYLMFHGISIKALAILPLNKTKRYIEAGLSLPLLGNLVRPPYNGYDFYIEQHQENVVKVAFRGKLASWNLYRGVDFRASYRSGFSGRVNFVVTYNFRYQYSNYPSSVNYFQNNITMGFVRR
jgi:hypothetical protein